MTNERFDDPDEDATQLLSGAEEAVPEQDVDLNLPGYRVIRPLGSGGMGQVLLARQTEPVDREVAIKLIRKQIRNPITEVRFLVERQALAQMHHPAIAQIYDAGTNPDGFPYFVMEYVRGQPLDTFCKAHHLPLRERLELFIRICQGISHAHQKGVIHRDLKPANVLVSMIDGVPVPKIIDFGIATTAGSPGKHQSESSAGTPFYMSPELFEQGAPIDTRSDVYSLGVMLYELLVDRGPHDPDLFRQTEPSMLRQRLTEKRPPRPSELMNAGTVDPFVDIAGRQRGRLPRLRRRLQGDLDAIATRAVDPDREARYAGAMELAEDIRAWLDGRPVRAMGASRGYRLRRFLTRHAWSVAAAALVAVSLVVGLTLAVIGMTEARQQQRLAEERAQELERMTGFQRSMLGDIDPRLLGAGFVERLRQQFEQSFDPRAAEETVEAGREAFELAVGRINPTDLAQDLIDEFILERAVESIESDFSDDPHLQAELFETVRDVYNSAGMIELSQPLARRIVELRLAGLGPDHTRTLEARQELYRLLSKSGQYEAANAQLDEIEARMDPENPRQLDLRYDTWDSRANLLIDTGHPQEALEAAHGVLARAEEELGPHHEYTVRALNTLGYVQALSGNMEAALDWFRQSLERARGHFDETENSYYSAMLNVGAALSGLGRHEEALAVQTEVYEILAAHFGRRNPSAIRSMNNIAVTLMDLERFDEATAQFSEIYRLGRETYGRHNPVTLRLQFNLGDALLRSGRPAAALEQFEDVARRHGQLESDVHPDRLAALEMAARAQLELGRHEQALENALFVHQGRAAQSEGGDDDLQDTRALIAEIHAAAGRTEEAQRWRAAGGANTPTS